MKKILGLDLGTTSIGWAYVGEAENASEQSKITALGVRVNPLSVDEKGDFEKGKSISINADRTLKRSMRRNLNRHQDRRDDLIKTLKREQFITDETSFAETGKHTTHLSYKVRAKAAVERIEKEELARVLLMLNKKRGYKSSRKAKTPEEGEAIDGMEVAKKLYDNNLTPGQYNFERLSEGKKHLPDYYRSDLQAEFDKIWKTQKTHYPEILTEELYENLKGKNKGQTWKICEEPFGIKGISQKGTPQEKKLEAYTWRVAGLTEKLDLEHLAIVLQEINFQINQSSGYLGEISDRSKELYFNKQTIGQYLYNQVKKNIRARLKRQVFYRQDYLDEFETIWETQRKFHPELTDKLKEEIRDTIIFYQRKLKSQKGLIGFCEFERKEIDVTEDGKQKKKTIGARVIPKSSPLFQEFKIWQNLNALRITNKKTGEKYQFDQATKQAVFEELNLKGNLKANEFLKLVAKKPSDWELNFEEVEGNRTNAALYEAYIKMMLMEGHEIDTKKLSAQELKSVIADFFQIHIISNEILDFNSELDGVAFEKQPAFKLWHVLYSFQDDPMKPGHIEKLYAKLKADFGFKREFAKILENVPLSDDYASLSTKAIRKIFPFIKEHKYDDACALAGYNHSHSVTAEDNEKRVLQDKLDILPKNSLRNPVVEKILNQMINVVNAVMADSTIGRPDEIRLELARELKKSAKERAEMTSQIGKSKKDHDTFRGILQNEFGIKNPTRNDIIRYKLYLELKSIGFKTPYSQTYIPREKLFSKEFDIEHIIPQARLFDDSFSNKTLESRDINLEKGDKTAADFVLDKYGEKGLEAYKERLNTLLREGVISKGKLNKLLMTSDKIPDGFIDRDLRDTQYIAKKAREILMGVTRTVSTTTGSITEKLREDWDLVNVMKELNLEKYRALGMTEFIEMKNGQKKEIINDWTKRNDHRHHAMDALTVAFTTPGHVQYLNYQNARKDENHKKHSIIHALENKLTTKDARGKRLFIPPMTNFREEAKSHLEAVLVSHKARNKVVTRNINKIKTNNGTITKTELTPRGQLHKETVYGQISRYQTKEVKVGGSFDQETIAKVANKKYREALLQRLEASFGDPKKAFTGANSPAKKPIYTDSNLKVPEKVKLVELLPEYVIRKEVSPDNFKDIKQLDKVIDVGVRKKLEKRLAEFGNNPKEAFSNLGDNPIWLDDAKTIPIKTVRITGVSNAEPLHHKQDHIGNTLKNANGEPIPSDFVSTGNNHHVAIYRDENRDLQEMVVSFAEAVRRAKSREPIIDKDYNQGLGWQFLFTMKQNEYFLFPSDGFDPNEMDLKDPVNFATLGPHLFRVQKFTIRDYFFRHHLETDVENRPETNGVTWKREGLNGITDIIKVRLNHLGRIVQVGEY